MDDVKEALFISLFFSVAVVGEFFDTLIQNMSLTIPNNLITFSIVLLFCIIWFKKEISKNNESQNTTFLTEKEQYIKSYINIQPNERKMFRKLNNQLILKFIIFFSMIWSLISGFIIYIIANYIESKHQSSEEFIISSITFFAIVGVGILLVSLINELNNSFPDIRKIFEKYNYEAIENYKGYIKNPTWKKIKIHYLHVREMFVGKLKNNSFIEYKMEVWLEDPLNYRNVKIDQIGAEINIKIDMKKVLRKNQFNLLNKDEILARFKEYFPGKLVFDMNNIEYSGGFFYIFLSEKFNKIILTDYLIAVMKSCQELEDTFSFPLKKE